MSFQQLDLHELRSPLEEEFELGLGLGLAGYDIVGSFVLELAVTVPFQRFENPPGLQELHLLLDVMRLIGRIDEELEESIVCFLL